MSADRDRGVRRQKQKRAKQLKKAAKRQNQAPVAGGPLATSPAGQQAS